MEGRGLVGPAGRHPYAVAGERRPRGGRPLSTVGTARAHGSERAEAGRAASAVGRIGRQRPAKKRNSFLFLFFNQNNTKMLF
jgi:hypothetical protein